MGVLGQTILSNAGHIGGGYLANKFLGNEYKSQGQNIGSAIGTGLGYLTPYETGGRVRGAKKGEPTLAILHTGEFILPINIKPTKEQKSKIEKLKKIKREKLPNYFV